MMRPHCDRCDKLIDAGYPTWLEDNESFLDSRGQPMKGSGSNPIWHINVGENKMFCKECLIIILETYVSELKLNK